MFMPSFFAVPAFVGDFGSVEFPQYPSEESSLTTFVGEVAGLEVELKAGSVENPDFLEFERIVVLV